MKEAFYTKILNNKFKIFGTGAELLGLPVYYIITWISGICYDRVDGNFYVQ